MSKHVVAALLLAAFASGLTTKAAAQLDSAVELRAEPHAGQDARRQQLRLEIEELRREEASISQSGPVVMMIFGYVFAPMLLVGPVLLLIDGAGCDSGGDQCIETTTAGLVLTGLGVAGAGVGLAGIIIGMENSDQRRYLRGRIEDKERELDSLSLRLQLQPHGAGLALSGAF